MNYTVSFVERCPTCGEDIHWRGRISERPACQNCERISAKAEEREQAPIPSAAVAREAQ